MSDLTFNEDSFKPGRRLVPPPPACCGVRSHPRRGPRRAARPLVCARAHATRTHTRARARAHACTRLLACLLAIASMSRFFALLVLLYSFSRRRVPVRFNTPPTHNREPYDTLLYCPTSCDQVIREDPAVRSSCVRGRGTETSAEVLVGPPWRMESERLKTAVVLG
jgi:hypothetical protein